MKSPPQVAILAIGSEITDGRVVNTNATRISELLNRHGYEVSLVIACPDTSEAIQRSLRCICSSTNIAIVCGGIGPTEDDLTRDELARFFDTPLEFHERALTAIQERFRARGKDCPAANRKQALFPEGSIIMPNSVGSASGFQMSFETQRSNPGLLFSLPGVPSELDAMLKETVLPTLLEQFPLSVSPQHSDFQYFGLPESAAATMLSDFELPKSSSISYRASFPVLKIRFSTRESSAKDHERIANTLRATLGESRLFSNNAEDTLSGVLHEILLKQGIRLGLAESCTGGGIGSLLTDNPGSSSYLEGGIISYSNRIKRELLDVPQELLSQHGAVSHEVALAMATGVRLRTTADIGCSVTGIAGPDGGSEQKPVGTFYLGFVTASSSFTGRFFIPAQRKGVRRYAAYCALDVLRRHLMNLPLGELALEERLT